jgi:type II secretory pathway component PulJ
MAAYRTYNWGSRPVEKPLTEMDRLDWLVRSAIERTLRSKGYVEDTEGPADFLVDSNIRAKDATVNTIVDFQRYREMGGKLGLDEAYVFGYREGKLSVEILDGRSRTLVWRATATAVVDPSVREQTIEDAVRLMLEQFPAT